MLAIETALDKFSALHDGRPPTEVVITPAATVALAAGRDFKISALRGIPVRVAEFDASESVKPGDGTRLGIFVNDNLVQLHVAAVDLR